MVDMYCDASVYGSAEEVYWAVNVQGRCCAVDGDAQQSDARETRYREGIATPK